MPAITDEQLKQATRLKTIVDLARDDYHRTLSGGFSKSAQDLAATHYRQCEQAYRAFLRLPSGR